MANMGGRKKQDLSDSGRSQDGGGLEVNGERGTFRFLFPQ